MNRKQLILLFAGAVGVLLVFVIFLALQQSPQKSATVTNVTADHKGSSLITPGKTATGKNAAKPTPLPKQLSAADTARAFYYATAVGNPLANGGYKTNQYLSGRFKDNVEAYYDEGNRPVFCPKNRRPQITVGKEEQVYYDKGYITLEFIMDATTGKDLYIVKLENLFGQWQIVDISCLKQ